MKERLLITTAIGLMLGTAVFAQSPNEQSKTKSPPAAQSQTNTNQTNANSPQTNSNPSAASGQNAQSGPSGSQQPAATTGQASPSAAGSNDPARSQAQSNQASPPPQTQNNAGSAPSQAQPAGQPSSSQAQTNTPPPANNQTTGQTQQAPGATTSTGTQPSSAAGTQPPSNQAGTAQAPSSSTNVNVSASLNDTQRTRFSESIARLNISPITNVNFSLSVGTVVPRDLRLQPLPADVVEIVPQYRGYNFVIVRDDIVIIEPSTYKIVDVLPRRGRSSAGAPASQPTAAAPASRKTTISERDREVIRKQSRAKAEQPRVEQRTTGSATTSTRLRVGDRLPDSVEFRSFPDVVYRDSPSLREYRYIERNNRTYLIEPGERTIIEEID
jgi:hypothetical protein